MSRLDQQNRTPKVEILPDFRLRVTRNYDCLNYLGLTQADFLAYVSIPWATADEKYLQCRLIKQDLSGQIDFDANQPNKFPPTLTRVFEEIPATAEVMVGDPEVDVGADGLTTVIELFLQFSTALPGITPVYGVPGTTLAAAPWAACTLKLDERTDDGTLQRIKRTYISAGLISESESIKFNGALSLKTFTYVNQTPPTPSGYTIIDTKVEAPNGLPVYTYTFAKGTGLISETTTFEISPDQGVSGITRTSFRYISLPSVSVDPTIALSPADSIQISSEEAEQDGYRLWTSEYVTGTGLVSADVDVRNNGLLYIYTRMSINAFPPTPAASIGGSVVLIRNSQRNGTRIENGTTIYEATWAEGNGLISVDIVTRQDGLREVTNISIGTAQPPTGILIRDEASQETGYTVFRQSAIQAANGAATPVGTTTTFQRNVPYLYPGVAKAYTITAENGWKAYDVFRRPPTQTDILGNVIVTYSLSGNLGALTYPLWNPSNWATIEAQWIGLNNIPGFSILALPGYRSFSATPLTFVASIWEGTTAGTMLGNVVYGGTTAVLAVIGGPAAPDGNTYTLDQAIELAFTATDGTKYYRQTIVTATIPAQPALPV